VDGYSAVDGWALAYFYILQSGDVEVALTTAQDGDGSGFLATIDATAAALFTTVGTWLWRAVVTKGTETVTVDRGRLELLDTLEGTGDRRLWLEKIVDALEAKLEGRATTQQLGYSVEGRSLSLMGFAEVLDARDRLKAELTAVLDQEARANGERRTTAVRVRLWGA